MVSTVPYPCCLSSFATSQTSNRLDEFTSASASVMEGYCKGVLENLITSLFKVSEDVERLGEASTEWPGEILIERRGECTEAISVTPSGSLTG